MVSCEFCEISNSISSEKHLRATASAFCTILTVVAMVRQWLLYVFLQCTYSYKQKHFRNCISLLAPSYFRKSKNVSRDTHCRTTRCTLETCNFKNHISLLREAKKMKTFRSGLSEVRQSPTSWSLFNKVTSSMPEILWKKSLRYRSFWWYLRNF